MFKFYLKKPFLIITDNEKIKEFLFKIISPYFLVSEKRVFLLKPSVLILKPIKRIIFFIKHSKLPILIPDLNTKELRSYFPPNGYLILNYDKESFGKEVIANIMTYGFEKGADFLITDLNFLNKEVNFKINYKGNVIPFWVKNIEEKNQVYDVVSAIVASFSLGLNLVEISKVFQIKEKMLNCPKALIV